MNPFRALWQRRRSCATAGRRTPARSRGLFGEVLEPRAMLAGDFGFAHTFGFGEFRRDVGNDVVIDSAGNVYFTGEFSGTVDFDPGPNVFDLTAVGAWDGVIAKYAASGELIWAQPFGSAGLDGGSELAIDPGGNLWVTGRYSGTTDFDAGPGTALLTAFGEKGEFLLKLTADGGFQWVGSIEQSTINNNGEETIFGIDIDGNGNVFAAGWFSGSADLNPGPETFEVGSVAGTYDAFVLKIDNSGNFLWAKTFGGNVQNGLGDRASDVATDAAGNAYVTGSFAGTVDLDPGPGVASFSTRFADLDYDNFISKFDPAGNLVWVRVRGGIAHDLAEGIAVDGAGGVYTVGTFESTYDFDPGPGEFNLTGLGNHDVFVAKLDSGGNHQWAVQLGGGGEYLDIGYDLALDDSGEIYVTGEFAEGADFDPGPNVVTLGPVSGNQDAFVARLGPGGQFIGAYQLGGSGVEIGSAIALNRLTHEVFVTGRFNAEADFDPGAGVASRTTTGQDDSFLVKLLFGNSRAADDSFSASEDTALKIAAPGVLGNDSAGGSTLTAELENGPLHGTVTLNPDGSFRYTPAANYRGPDRFTYRTTDGTDFSPVATVALTVDAVNDPPSGADRTIVTLEDTAYDLQASDFGFSDPADADGNSFTAVRITSLPIDGLLTHDGVPVLVGMVVPIGDTLLLYTPAADANGIALARFTFQVQDNGGTANGGVDRDPSPNTITFDVIGVNDAPSFALGPDQDASDESGEVSLPGWATEIAAGPADEAGQALSFQISVSDPNLFSQRPTINADGTLSYTPAMNVEGTAVVSVALHDDGGTEHEGSDASQAISFEIRIVKLHPMHNFEMPLDATGDREITASDALDAINYLNAFGTADVLDAMDLGGGFLDINADGFITAADPLEVINYLNAFGPTSLPPDIDPDASEDDTGEGEGAAAADDFSTLVGLLAADAAESAMRRRQRG